MIDKIKSLIVSMKFHSLVASTVLFSRGVLSENGWIMVVLTVVGMREAHKIAGAYRDVAVSKAAKVKAK